MDNWLSAEEEFELWLDYVNGVFDETTPKPQPPK